MTTIGPPLAVRGFIAFHCTGHHTYLELSAGIMDHVGGAASGGSGTAAEPVDRVVDLAAVARDTATAFRRANVLIAGLKGLGTEIGA